MILIQLSICYAFGFLALILSSIVFPISDKLFYRMVVSSALAGFVLLAMAFLTVKPFFITPFSAFVMGHLGIIGFAVLLLSGIFF